MRAVGIIIIATMFLNYSISVKAIGYERPNGASIITTLTERNPSKQHPRLMLTPSRVTHLRNLAVTDPKISAWTQNLIANANDYLLSDVLTYSLQNGSILYVSRAARDRIQTLAMAYLLTGDSTFAASVWTNLEAVCEFPDWNPAHFLSTAEMAAAVSIGFDWCYDSFNASQINTIKNALRDKALVPAYQAYAETYGVTKNHNRMYWKNGSGNWNAVCNGGIALAALAIGDESETSARIQTGSSSYQTVDLPGECLESGLVSLENLLTSFAPDGAWFEGVTYWQYMMRYYAMYMSSLESAVGTNYGRTAGSGISDTGYYPIYLTGSAGTFNYGDSKVRSMIQSPEMLYLAKEFGNTDYSAFRYRQLLTKSGDVRDILWYDETTYSTDLSTMPKDKNLNGGAQLALMRTGWSGNDTFLGLKAGDVVVGHGHHDTGSFILDADGVRWGIDLGAEDYYSDYFDKTARYYYYRTRAEGHNTIVINPSYEDCVTSTASSSISLFSSESNSYAVTDMTNVYSEHATSAKRAVALTNDKTIAFVQDEINLKSSGELYWFMHTDAEIVRMEDNTAALLKKSNKYMYMKILSPANAEFDVLSATPLPSSPIPAVQNNNEGIQKLSIHMTNVTNTTITVAMVPLGTSQITPVVYPVVRPISDWGNLSADIAKVNWIKMNDDSIPLSNGIKDYSVSLDRSTTLENINIVVDTNYTPIISCPSFIPGTARIIVTQPDNILNTVMYTIGLKYGSPPVQSYISENETAANLFDNNDETSYVEEGFSQVVLDLGSDISISSVSILWGTPGECSYEYNIHTSTDGVFWGFPFRAGNSSYTNGYETYSAMPVKARYIRITSNGNNVNNTNVISEVIVDR